MPAIAKPKVKRCILKGCNCCGGDLFLESIDPKFLWIKPEYVCLQCGRRKAVDGN